MEPAAGAAPAFVGPAYEPMLKIEAGGEQAYAYVAPKEPSDWGTVEEIRALVGKSGDYFASQEAYTKYQEFCAVTKIEDVGGKEFHELAEITYAYIHRPKGGSTGGPCMVYFHGGMQIAGGPEQSTHFLNRYVAEANITIISVKYRLAPEARTPCQIADGFAAFVDVVTNPAKFGIDATKVGFFGDSTGAYIAAGVGMVRVRSTGNLLENPDVVLSTQHSALTCCTPSVFSRGGTPLPSMQAVFSRGGSLLPSLHADGRSSDRCRSLQNEGRATLPACRCS